MTPQGRSQRARSPRSTAAWTDTVLVQLPISCHENALKEALRNNRFPFDPTDCRSHYLGIIEDIVPKIMLWQMHFLEAEREEASRAARVDMVVDFAQNPQVHYNDSTPLTITFWGCRRVNAAVRE